MLPAEIAWLATSDVRYARERSGRPEFAQTAPTRREIQTPVDDLIGNLVDLAQALQIDRSRRQAHDLRDFGEIIVVRGIRKRHHDRRRRRQHVARKSEPRADEIDHVLEPRRRRAVFVQALGEIDDEADAYLERRERAGVLVHFEAVSSRALAKSVRKSVRKSKGVRRARDFLTRPQSGRPHSSLLTAS